MSERSRKRGFASRPGDAERWIKASEARPRRVDDASAFSARLTIDVAPALRSRIKVAAFQRGVTVAEMLRELLAREFPTDTGEPS
ncbi:ribbon-helix-helix protein [Bradyrhizobium sp. BR 1432]|uniref:ribbon-helix-helix protein n=1 Tax=Bradyrhizobium sp. BR 1432 TaxID=3447966 RepID=UPI003EE47C26